MEVGGQPLEERERRFAHQVQHVVLGVFGCHLEPPRGVVFQHGLQVRRLVEQIVADAAADKGFLNPFDGPYFFVQGQQRPVVVVEIGAYLRVETRRTAALAAQLPVAAAHAVHVGRRGADIRKVAFEPGRFHHMLHFGEDRPLAARIDELALMRRNGAERAAAEAAAVDVDRMADHLPGRNVALARVTRMRGALVGEVERVVEFFGRERRVGGRHDHAPVADGLHECRRGFHQVALGLDDGEVLAEGGLVGQTLLVAAEADRRGGVEPRDVAFVGEERHLPDFAQQFGVIAVAHRPGHLLHDPFAHAVDQQVGARFGQDGGFQRVAPVVVVGQAAQRGFDAPDDHRNVGVEALEDLRIDRHGTIGAESRLAAGRVGVVVAQAEVGGVMVDHRVHRAARNAEKQARSAQFAEVAQVVAPVGLGNDRHAVALGFEQASHDGRPESWVVDVGVAREEDHVQLIPSAFADLLDGRR